jgi:flagellar assembly protein FliH
MPGEILKEQYSDFRPVLWRTAKQLAGTRPQNDGPPNELVIASRLEQARREGFASGVASSQQEAEQELLPAVQEVAQAVAELACVREVVRDHATNDLVKLAIAIAARVIHRQVAVEPDVLAGLLKAAFSKLQAREIARARVHPEFEPALRRCLDQNGAPANLCLSADRSVKAGALVFEFDEKLDASLEADLSEIERGLSDKLSQ